MGNLIFRDVSAVRELYEHTKQCSNHRKTYGEETGPGLWLVHDQGVYLMSPGIPPLTQGDESDAYKVVYAEGCHPKKDRDWHHAARALVGGDDFAEHLSIDMWDELFADEKVLLKICIECARDSIALRAEYLRESPDRRVTGWELDDIV